MDGDKDTRLERALLTLVERQNRRPSENLTSFLDGLHPLIKVSAPVFAAFLWFQSNFASIQMYKEQEIKLVETNQRMDAQLKDMKQVIEQRHQESLTHSNDNRDRMIAVMNEIKDSLKTLYLEKQVKH